ncbi:glycosyltransferase family 4 protein [Pseudophaeobacter sp. 1A16562]|uniref:glycosyltransferase family 4 protein n=1 Tax=unclassified Pseudophaeobacter TaxID=2637024 RepID=UPI0034D735AB
MPPLLKVTGTDRVTQVLSCRVKPREYYAITLQFWSYEAEGSKENEKAGLLIFSFCDAEGNAVAAPDTLHRTSAGDAFRYINLTESPNFTVGLSIPARAVMMRLEIRPWKHRKFSAEILKVKRVSGAATKAVPNLFSRPELAIMDFPSMSPAEMSRRFFLEAMMAEQNRKKRDFPKAAAAPPSQAELHRKREYRLALDYVGRRGPKGKRPRHLLIGTSYPSSDQVYASAFLHSRVKAYMAADAEVDVLSFARSNRSTIWRYEGVDVLSGYVHELTAILTAGDYDSVSIHFLHPHMWSVLQNFFDRHRFHLFVHGHGARDWSRTFDPALGLTSAHQEKVSSDLYRDMWQAILREPGFPESFIFVSDWMRQCAEDDMLVHFPRNRSHVVHNPIDTDLFAFQKKPTEHARRILLIRNFDKYIYATDIAIRCMEELRRRPIWDSLAFTVYGQGQNLCILRDFFGREQNVTIHERFLTSDQIRAAHRDHGIMLIPSRLDSQGVSRDEAMSSGLVPATNAVCAIPEFVDDSCAILAPSEDHIALADGIERLTSNADLFQRMSAAAAARVRAQSSLDDIIRQEMNILGIGDRLP